MVEKLSGDITYQYGASPLHRLIQADGMWGGATHRGSISVSFFSERAPFPTTAILKVEDGIPLGAEQIEAPSTVFREVEVTVRMDLNVAVSFYVWLEDKIRVLSAASGMSQDQLDTMIGQTRGLSSL